MILEQAQSMLVGCIRPMKLMEAKSSGETMETDTTSSHSRSRRGTWILGRSPKWTLIRVMALVIVCFLVRDFVLLPVKVQGPSMEPTYREGGVNFVNRWAYLRSEPKRGDVVAIRLSNPSLLPPSVMFLKRIVGLPGETIQFHDGHLWINGRILEEPYLSGDWDWDSPAVTLDSNQYYVVGDNRTMPESMHEEGRARRDHIVGKILLCKSLFAPSSSSR